MDLHVSIKVMGVQLEVQQDTSNCLYHCPICTTETFRPSDLKTARRHLESHIGRSFHHGGYTIYKCHLKCRKTQHFHCYKCSGSFIRRVDILKHISSCTTPPAAHRPVSTEPAAAPKPVTTTPPAAPLPVTTTPPAAPLPVTTTPPAAPMVTLQGHLAKRRQNIIQCPDCNLLLNSKNWKRHRQRRHATVMKDLPVDRSLQTVNMSCSEVTQATISSPVKGLKAGPEVKAVLKFAKLTENATVPTKGSAKSAGYDLYSAYDYSIPPMDKVIVKTDIQIAVPPGCYGRVAPRSGLTAKYFIDVGAGVVDEDYRGNVGVVLFNFSKETFEVKKGDRIAQLICEKICYPELEQLETLDETVRGAGGFGSTGRN